MEAKDFVSKKKHNYLPTLITTQFFFKKDTVIANKL